MKDKIRGEKSPLFFLFVYIYIIRKSHTHTQVTQVSYHSVPSLSQLDASTRAVFADVLALARSYVAAVLPPYDATASVSPL